MSKLRKDHIVNRHNSSLDLDYWLEEMFKSHECYKYSPTIVMGKEAFEIFRTLVQRIEMSMFGPTTYEFNGIEFPGSWITVDRYVDPYYISIEWEKEPKVFFFDNAPFPPIFPIQIKLPTIKKVIYNDPATIIFWSDKTKTVVQCQEGDDYDPEKGLAMAIAKKALGNTSRELNDVLHKWEKKEEPSVRHSCSTCKYGNVPLFKAPCKSCAISYDNWEANK